MKIILSLAFSALTVVAFAQTNTKDTAYTFKHNQSIDTTGMSEYGMRIYDPRMTRYMPPDTASRQNPYYFANKKKKHKNSR